MFEKAILLIFIAIFTRTFVAKAHLEKNARMLTLANTGSRLSGSAMSRLKKRNDEYVPGDWFKSHLSAVVKRNPQTKYRLSDPKPHSVLIAKHIFDPSNHISKEDVTTNNSSTLSNLESTIYKKSNGMDGLETTECRIWECGRGYLDAANTITMMLNVIKRVNDVTNASTDFTKESMIERLVSRRKQLADLQKRNEKMKAKRLPRGFSIFRSLDGRTGGRNRFVLKRPFDSLASGLIGKRTSHSYIMPPF